MGFCALWAPQVGSPCRQITNDFSVARPLVDVVLAKTGGAGKMRGVSPCTAKGLVGWDHISPRQSGEIAVTGRRVARCAWFCRPTKSSARPAGVAGLGWAVPARIAGGMCGQTRLRREIPNRPISAEPNNRNAPGKGITASWPRISPPGKSSVWTLM